MKEIEDDQKSVREREKGSEKELKPFKFEAVPIKKIMNEWEEKEWSVTQNIRIQCEFDT